MLHIAAAVCVERTSAGPLLNIGGAEYLAVNDDLDLQLEELCVALYRPGERRCTVIEPTEIAAVIADLQRAQMLARLFTCG